MHWTSIRSIFQIVLVGLAFGGIPAAAQDGAPRSASGNADLTGTYNGSTLTPLVRPAEFGSRLELSDEEAEEIARSKAEIYAAEQAPSDPNREAPPIGGVAIFDPSLEGASGGSGGYNSFYMDPGSTATKIDGKWRTSILVDPPDGQMPGMTPEGLASFAQAIAAFAERNTGTAWWIDKESGPYDNMEQRPDAERCLLGFSGATPPFPSLYNNYKRIVQTEDHVMIWIEMNHDARVVRLNSEHQPSHVRSWLGDSIGWWEGHTLVVESTNFRAGTQARGGSENLKVTERLTKLGDGDLLYRFTVDDPSVWTAPWTGEYLWRSTEDRVFEYACHEGNYALGNIMRGARLLEREALEKKAHQDP